MLKALNGFPQNLKESILKKSKRRNNRTGGNNYNDFSNVKICVWVRKWTTHFSCGIWCTASKIR